MHSSLADFRRWKVGVGGCKSYIRNVGDIEIAPASSSTHNDLTLSQISIQKATEFEQVGRKTLFLFVDPCSTV